MDLMLDTNIVLDHIANRKPFAELSRRVCLLGITGEATTYISAHMIIDVFYLLRKIHGSLEAQRIIEEDLDFLQVVGVSSADIAKALSMKWNDFEDCLVACCAQKIGADFIITRNSKDFARSPVTALTPEELFEELEARGIIYEEVDFSF